MITKHCGIVFLFLLTDTVLLFQACTKPVDPLEFAGSRREKIYPQKIDTVIAMSGINRVQLKIPKPTDPQVQSIGIFWNLGADSLKASFGKSDTLTVNIDHIDQELFSFNIYTYDQSGNRSVTFTSSVPVYGIKYLSHIINRPVNFIVNRTDSNMVTINWGSLGDTTAIGTEVRFKNIHNQPDSVFIPDDTLAVNRMTIIRNTAKQPSIWTQTLYYPPASLDTFRSDYSEVPGDLVLDISKPSGEGSQSAPFKVNSFGNLVWMTQNSDSWDKYYVQTADIDAAGSKNPFFKGKGFTPIASGSKFTGVFDGRGHNINNLNIGGSGYIGLFSQISGSNAAVINLHLNNVVIKGTGFIGGIAGQSQDGIISGVSVSGVISGTSYNVAGFVGKAVGTTIRDSYNQADISSSGATNFGGIVGNCTGCIIENAYNMGDVSGTGKNGGLVGILVSGTIKNAYNVGIISNPGKIDTTLNGAIVNDYVSGMISNTYFLNNNTTADKINMGSIMNESKEEMMKQSTFNGFDFSSVWAIDEGAGYPYLRDNEQIPHPGK